MARTRTLAAMTSVAMLAGAIAASFERHLVRGESMKPALLPGDTVISIKARSLLGVLRRPVVGDIAVIELPWEHDLIGLKRLVAGPSTAWSEDDDRVREGPGWVAVGDQRVLSTDSRHHGRVLVTALRGVVVGRVRPSTGKVEMVLRSGRYEGVAQ